MATPGRSVSPSSASFTCMAQVSLRRLAKARENSGGMCCAMSVAGVDAGRRLSTAAMASVPPVEAPMATIVSGGSAEGAGGGEAGRGAGSGPWRRTRAAAAARTFCARPCRNSPTEYGPPGLASTSTAPVSSAWTAIRQEVWASELMTTTGSGWYCISLRRNVSPSMRGISISSVSTSGASEMILSRATYGSGAVPTISMSGSSLKASARILRTIAESSTINTRIFRFSDIGACAAFP
jgi:hypothetical protein